MDMAKVGLAADRLWCVHAQEMDIAKFRHLGERSGESQSAGVKVLPEQRFKARLEEWRLAIAGPRDLVCIHVEPHHIMAEISHADRVGERSEERRVGQECRSRWSPDH